MTIEKRSGAPAELRVHENGEVRVAGHAAVFNQEADIAGLFRERIEPGAFRDAIGRDDVVFLVNHDGLPLARTRSGTLTLREDNVGLFMETTLDAADPDVQSIIRKMQRGDLDKMSFAFAADLQEWDDSGDVPIRTIKRARLFDVSIVTTPAYEGTDIGIRNLNEHRSRERQKNFNAARMRLRMKRDLAMRENG